MEQDQLLQKAFSYADAMKVYKVRPIDRSYARLVLRSPAGLSTIVDMNADHPSVVQDECYNLVASALQFNDPSEECDGEWNKSVPHSFLYLLVRSAYSRIYRCSQLLDIHDSLFAWHQLDSLASFLQSEEIASMLSYYRGKIAEKCANSSVFLLS